MKDFFALIISEIRRNLNKLDKKHRIYWGVWVIVILILIILFSFLLWGGNTGKIKNLLRWTSGPKYTNLIESIDSKYYKDAYFLGCFKERITLCSKDHLWGLEIPLSGSFLDNINTLTKKSGNENFDNCVGDGVNSCYDLSIKNTITKTPDASNCGSYEDVALRQNCLNESYPKMAISKDDIRICESNKESYWLKYCQDSFNQDKAIKSKDISYCDKLSDDSTKKLCRDNYYFSIALAAKDISLCKGAGNTTAISNCASNFINQSVFSGPTKDCESLKTYGEYISKQEISNMYNRCTLENLNMQLSKLDPIKNSTQYKALCDQITDELPKKDCLKRVESPLMGEPPTLVPVDINTKWTGSIDSDTETISGALSPEKILKKLKSKK